jgi:hypothetical protein
MLRFYQLKYLASSLCYLLDQPTDDCTLCPSLSMWVQWACSEVCGVHGLPQGFRESEASSIDIPNIGYETFTAMMRYIYVGSVEVEQELALPLLQVRHDMLSARLCSCCVCCDDMWGGCPSTPGCVV